jgi:hypothetical protein
MRYARFASVLLIAILPVLASADDQKKAEKQLDRISAMAADLTGRRVVNMSMAEHFKTQRSLLVRERRANNLNYGSLFVIQELVASGNKFSDIAEKLKSGRSLVDVANELHANWKEIGENAKDLNKEIEDNLYNFFLNNRSERYAEPGYTYDPIHDGVMADLKVSEEGLEDAQYRYVFWRDRATSRKDNLLNHTKEMAARQTVDPIRKGGPQPDQVGTIGPTPR